MRIKNYVYAFVVVLFSVAMVNVLSGNTHAATGVAINATNFPDATFRDYVSDNFDTYKDGYLTNEEISNIKSIYIYNQGVTTIKGVEYFTSLKSLDISYNKVTSLDVSNNKELTSLHCTSNKIPSVDLRNNSKLTYINFNYNDITSLDISNCKNLIYFYCGHSKVKSLDLSNNKSLKYLEIIYNDQLTSVDLSGCTQLTEFKVFEGQLKSANLKGCTSLESIWCPENQITYLNFEDCPNVTEIFCPWNQLSSLDVSNNTLLTFLCCGDNKISELDVRYNTRLNHLECSNNILSELDVSKNTKLTYLACHSNNLSKLDISNNTKLEHLFCYGNRISNLDINKLTNVIEAYINGSFEIKTDEDTGAVYYYFEHYNGYELAFGINTKLYFNGMPQRIVTPTPTSTPIPIRRPTATPTAQPIKRPTATPTAQPIKRPTATPTAQPIKRPTATPTAQPTDSSSASLWLNYDIVDMICGKTLTLKATLKGSSSRVTWKSSDSKVATVDANGKVAAKMAGIVTITATAAGMSTECEVTVLYKDVTSINDFWYVPTNYLTAMGVVKGYDNQTKFKPANNCTRAQMVTFIWRLMGEPSPDSSTCKFSDVKKTDYFYKACLWGNENHIVEGYKDGTFGPQIVCARKHAVTFLWRLADKPSPKSKTNKFKDVKKSDYFYTATLWASEKGILAGYSDNTFRPNGDCLRRQMVTFLYKYDKYVNLN